MPPKPIIIIKKVSGHGGHHGGAWKVAYADFVTAMMALFIVLWLLSSSVKVKKAVAGYFNDPKSSQKETGRDKSGDGKDNDDTPMGPMAQIDKANVEKLKQQIEKAIKEQKNFAKLAKQIEITITPEGLRIELLEDKSGTFFQSGSAKLSDSGQQLLALLAGELKPLPNRLLLEGHTDAQPYSGDNGYTNWELSADRANAARRLLQSDGVGQKQISQVRGYADQLLRVKTDPMDPTNRRISLIVQWVDAAAPPAGGTEVLKAGDTKAPDLKGAQGKPAAAAPAVEAKPEAAKPESAKPEAAKPESAKPEAVAQKLPAGKTTAPVPDKAGILDKLKKMLPGGKPK